MHTNGCEALLQASKNYFQLTRKKKANMLKPKRIMGQGIRILEINYKQYDQEEIVSPSKIR